MGTKLSVTMEDAYGRTTTRVYGMEDQALLADYITASTSFLAALEAVTDLACVKASFIIPLADPTWDVVAGANVDSGATASGWVDAGQKKASMKIPTIKPALVGSDGTVAITGAVATFLAEFEDAADFNLSDGEQIESWIRAKLDK